MQLCNEFGIKHAVMYDKDDETNPNHATWNSDVTSNKNAFTLNIKELDPDLESYVGFTTPTERNMKPVEVLNHLRAGSLEKTKAEEFIRFIES